MTENTGDYFIRDVEDGSEDDDLLSAPVIVPIRPPVPAKAEEAPPVWQAPVTQLPPGAASPPPPPVAEPAAAPVPPPAAEPGPPERAAPSAPTREERLTGALDVLMSASPDVQAAALVSLDGFTIASALPEGMQEDRVGAMSAAILGLGERAAVELGRGRLSQVFIEGSEGYVLLMAAGTRAVLTVLSGRETRLGLLLYDMRTTADTIGAILG